MAQTVKIVPYTYMHGNSKVDEFHIIIADGKTLRFPNRESALEYAKSHGYEVEGE